jgi:hypothetical protein
LEVNILWLFGQQKKNRAGTKSKSIVNGKGFTYDTARDTSLGNEV